METVVQSLFDHRIITGTGALKALESQLQMLDDRRLAVLCDEHTFRHCYPVLLKEIPLLKDAAVITVPAGEEHKTIGQAVHVWTELTRLQMGRNDIVLNLGGGVITDLGGFAAANYLRGIPFIQIPTSLLAMVDASLGGKTGVDLNHAKNRVGVVAFPMAVYCWPGFLHTLPALEWESACGEVLKHALLAGDALWSHFTGHGLGTASVVSKLDQLQQVKLEVVSADPHEKGRRKVLNFGHTMGHALESESLAAGRQLPHGFAVAWGMIMELEIAALKGIMSDVLSAELKGRLHALMVLPDISGLPVNHLMDWVMLDKKNDHQKVMMSLISSVGHPLWNIEVEPSLIRSVFQKYVQE